MTFSSYSFSEAPFSALALNNYQLSCAAGAYTITGGSASFTLVKSISANAGNYDVTGHDAQLKYEQLLNCETGNFYLTGNSVTFVNDQVIYAGAFSFILSGQEASLLKAHTITGEASSYVLTGSSANLLHDKSIVANAGNYIYTGKNAELIYSGTPVVVVESKGGIGKKEKKKREAEKASREELEAIIRREFDILDGTYQPEVVEVAKQAVIPQIKEIDYTQYEIALSQVNALLLQAKIQAAEYESELDDEEALLMLL